VTNSRERGGTITGKSIFSSIADHGNKCARVRLFFLRK
jgi:hypothetical protein